MKFDNGSINVEVVRKERKEERKKKFFVFIINSVIEPVCFSLALILYVSLSIGLPEMLGPSGNGPWSYLWTMFFLCPVIPETLRAINDRKWSEFPIYCVSLFAFLFIGMYYGVWHPYWAILMAIPAYYMLAGPLDRGIDAWKEYKKGKDDVIDVDGKVDRDGD